MAETAPRSPRALLLKLGVVALVVVAGAVLVLRGYDVKGFIQRALDFVRDTGPVAFFTAMATLPSLGAPLSAFALTAGPAFGPSLGMGWVIVLSSLAIIVNMALTYWLACHLLRPVLEKLFVRLNYRLPAAEAGDATGLIVLLRVIGLPFPVQNYLLGLARVPFAKYLVISFLVLAPGTIAFVVFGDALLHGKGRAAFLALSLLIALTAATQLVRRHYSRKARPAP